MAQYGKPEYWEDRYQKYPLHSLHPPLIETKNHLTGTKDTVA